VVEDLSVPLLHLLEGVCRVEGGNGDIATVDNREVFFEGVYAPDGVVAAAFLFAGRACADASRSEARAGAVGGARVIGEAENRDVEGLLD
jgi:hypothetical protein